MIYILTKVSRVFLSDVSRKKEFHDSLHFYGYLLISYTYTDMSITTFYNKDSIVKICIILRMKRNIPCPASKMNSERYCRGNIARGATMMTTRWQWRMIMANVRDVLPWNSPADSSCRTAGYGDSLTVKPRAPLRSKWQNDDDNDDDYDDSYDERYRGCPKNWQFLSDVTWKVLRGAEKFGRLKLPHRAKRTERLLRNSKTALLIITASPTVFVVNINVTAKKLVTRRHSTDKS